MVSMKTNYPETLLVDTYNKYILSKLDIIRRMYARDGRTVEEIAKHLGVSYDVFNVIWESPRFAELHALVHDESIRQQRTKTIENSLYRAAKGYARVVTVPMKVKVESKYITKSGKEGTRKSEEIRLVKTTEHVPPNVQAIIYWMSNRAPDNWMSDQRIQLSMSNKKQEADKPSEIKVKFVSADTEEQRHRIKKIDEAVGAIEVASTEKAEVKK